MLLGPDHSGDEFLHHCPLSGLKSCGSSSCFPPHALPGLLLEGSSRLGSQAPACAVSLPGGESCSGQTQGQTFPVARSARALRRSLPCAQSRAPSSSAPHHRLMVLRPPPALPAGPGVPRAPTGRRG